MRLRLLWAILLFAALLIFLNFKLGHSECILDCMLQSGTKCINNECVNVFNPVPTPAPISTPAPVNEIRLESKPEAQIVAVPIDCTGMDLTKLRIYLTVRQPPGPVSFYSDIFWFNSDSTVIRYFARKDILNRYVFIETDNPPPQFIGEDFNFTTWEDMTFAEFFKNKSCTELKAGGYFFQYGIGVGGFTEGAIFYFK